jgi:hypothetical protein
MRRLAALLGLLLITGCTSYNVPQASSAVQLALTRDDVQIGAQASGSGAAFGPIFFNWFFPTTPRSQANAIGEATKNAYEMGGADFILQPRMKAFYINLILFDYASTEVSGKAVTINLTVPKK